LRELIRAQKRQNSGKVDSTEKNAGRGLGSKGKRDQEKVCRGWARKQEKKIVTKATFEASPERKNR